ncbi:hypothetical protein EIN_053490 [Entamoeba invadens IP1]|uniref:hypothetical protein n=1 Tax=Entamoeba invadens IP1 TaxID=370355 RepID=UPI0002C3E2D5|nr:hypothetical protein EIN_053490 [Entamoeba invadens IP1]ELP93104.1 hypothetical protein EIN_053490 [Entamoeba invadens IP1]|eukprot:XP_004259875.1 hypothetical protein EIN_053490 [Entamoeba invadens IP1]
MDKADSTSVSSSTTDLNNIGCSPQFTLDYIINRIDSAQIVSYDEDFIDKTERDRLEDIKKKQNELTRINEARREQSGFFYSPQRGGAVPSQSRLNDFSKSEVRLRNLDVLLTLTTFYNTLSSWVGLNYYDIVYDSDEDGKMARDINSNICGLTDVMIVVISSEGYSFGCYNHKKIPKAGKSYKYIKFDKKYFAFSLRSPNSPEPKKFKPKHHGKSLCIWPNLEETYSITTKRFMKIKNPSGPVGSKSFFHTQFKKQFTDDSGKGFYYFTNESTFDIHRVVAVRWY